MPFSAAPADLLQLGTFAAAVPHVPHLWQLEAPLIARTLRAGTPIEAILSFLQSRLGVLLPAAWPPALERACREGLLATVRSVLLLESAVPLPQSRPALSTVLARTLSAHAAVVPPERVGELRHLLGRHGIDLDVGGMATGTGSQGGGDARIAAALGLEVLRTLQARGFPLPPLRWNEALDASLTEDERTGVALWARRVAATLDKRLDPDPSVDRDSDEGLPSVVVGIGASAMRAIIAMALERGDGLRLCYRGAARGAEQWRRVDPHRLDRRHGHEYLRAYCHLRQEERLFRLDRVVACDTIPATSGTPPVAERRPPQAEQRRAQGVEQCRAPEDQLQGDYRELLPATPKSMDRKGQDHAPHPDLQLPE